MAVLCANRDEMLKELAGRYQENLSNLGVVTENHLLEIFVSSSGSWTITISNVINNVACVIADGQHWQILPQAVGIPL